MALTNFIPRQTLVTAEWLNKVDAAVENNINNQNIVTVDAITAVNATALGLATGAVVEALGRAAAGDGGGGTLIFYATGNELATADGATIYSVTGGQLVRAGRTATQFRGRVDVNWAATWLAAFTAAAALDVPAYIPGGEYSIDSDTVGPNEGCAFFLTSAHSGLTILSDRAVLKPTGNKVSIFENTPGNYASNVTFEGIVFDNSANGLLQNQVKPVTPVPGGGVAGLGNGANSAINFQVADGLTVRRCKFIGFNTATQYVADFEDFPTIRGHFKSEENEYDGCVFENLIDTPETYELIRPRSKNQKDSINADTSIDPGHTLYVTNRTSGVPLMGYVDMSQAEDGFSSSIKIRKGELVTVVGVQAYGSGRGFEINNTKRAVLVAPMFKPGLPPGVTVDSGRNGINFDDCGVVEVIGGVLDMRQFAASGIRVRSDAAPSGFNKHLYIHDITILLDWTPDGPNVFTGFSAISVTGQDKVVIRNPRFIVQGSTPNTRAFIRFTTCTQAVVDRPMVIYDNLAAFTEVVRFEADVTGSSVRYCLLDIPGYTSGTIVTDLAGTNTIREVDLGTYSFPDAGTFFTGDPDTGLRRSSANVGELVAGGVGALRWYSDGSIRPPVDNTQGLGSVAQRWRNVIGTFHYAGAGAVYWTASPGSPEGVVTAPIGSMYSRTDGGAGTSFYIKESGTGNTGWVAK